MDGELRLTEDLHDADRRAAGRTDGELRDRRERQAGADVRGRPRVLGRLHERRCRTAVGCAVFLSDRSARLRLFHATGRSRRLFPRGHARFYEEVRQALALPEVVVLGHSFGATTALTYAALYPESTARCVAVAAFGIGPDADARQGGDAEAEALLARHSRSPWYEAARPVMDSWTERLLAATDASEMEQMMVTVLPFYLAEPDRPEVAARLAEMTRVM